MNTFNTLIQEDGELFGAELGALEEDVDEQVIRKLHEVCINHKLAEKLGAYLLPELNDQHRMFVDIEFNREGSEYKTLSADGRLNLVRPDIIIHNRKSGEGKCNLLVVECKKEDAPYNKIQDDQRKLKAFMTDSKYEYEFGLQVIYGETSLLGTLFFKSAEGHGIEQEPIYATAIAGN